MRLTPTAAAQAAEYAEFLDDLRGALADIEGGRTAARSPYWLARHASTLLDIAAQLAAERGDAGGRLLLAAVADATSLLAGDG